MKRVFLLISLMFVFGNFVYSQDDEEIYIPKVEKESTIKYKGHKYKIVKIGDDWWFAENFAYPVEGSKEVTSHEGNKMRIYTYEQAVKYCPKGWHIPSDEEWFELEKKLGMSEGSLKNVNRTLYMSPALEALNFTKNIAGFNDRILAAPYGIFWTSTEGHWKGNRYVRILSHPITDETRYIEDKRLETSEKAYFSVRYVKDKK